MELSATEKIKILLGRRNMTVSDLAQKLGTSRQNLSNKMSRNNFCEKELQDIALALNCSYQAVFTMEDTGDQI